MLKKAIIGNSFGSLVLADLLVSNKIRFDLIIDEKSGLGGHFRGIEVFDTIFDIGMVYFEHGFKHHKSSYSYAWQEDTNSFNQWISDNVKLSKIPTPKVMQSNQLFKDYFISNSMEAIISSSRFNNLGTVKISKKYHSSKKNHNSFFGLSYEEASKLNHGKDIHKYFMEPLVKKITNLSSKDLLATFHRLFWAPLYYPETINHALKDQHIDLEEYSFFYPDSGNSSEFIRRLNDNVFNSEYPNIISDKIDKIKINPDEINISFGSSNKKYSHAAIGTSENEAVSILNYNLGDLAPSTTSVLICFALVPSKYLLEDLSSLFINSEDFCSYRFVNQDIHCFHEKQFHRVTLEANADFAISRGINSSYEELMIDELKKLIKLLSQKDISNNDFFEAKVINAKGALKLPTIETVTYYDSLLEKLFLLPDNITPLGSLNGINKSSMNDQIVQASKVYEKWIVE